MIRDRMYDIEMLPKEFNSFMVANSIGDALRGAMNYI